MKANAEDVLARGSLIRRLTDPLISGFVLLTVLWTMSACGNSRSHQQEFRVEGAVIAVMEYGGQGDSGLQMLNSNYLIADGIAYYLHFSEYDCRVTGMDRPQGEEGLRIPAPKPLGPVMIYKHATYRVAGRVFEPPSPESSLPAQVMSQKELARRIEARMGEPEFAKLGGYQQVLVVTEADRMVRRASQIPKSYEGHPTKLLRVTDFELLPQKSTDKSE